MIGAHDAYDGTSVYHRYARARDADKGNWRHMRHGEPAAVAHRSVISATSSPDNVGGLELSAGVSMLGTVQR